MYIREILSELTDDLAEKVLQKSICKSDISRIGNYRYKRLRVDISYIFMLFGLKPLPGLDKSIPPRGKVLEMTRGLKPHTHSGQYKTRVNYEKLKSDVESVDEECLDTKVEIKEVAALKTMINNIESKRKILEEKEVKVKRYLERKPKKIPDSIENQMIAIKCDKRSLSDSKNSLNSMLKDEYLIKQSYEELYPLLHRNLNKNSKVKDESQEGVERQQKIKMDYIKAIKSDVFGEKFFRSSLKSPTKSEVKTLEKLKEDIMKEKSEVSKRWSKINKWEKGKDKLKKSAAIEKEFKEITSKSRIKLISNDFNKALVQMQIECKNTYEVLNSLEEEVTGELKETLSRFDDNSGLLKMMHVPAARYFARDIATKKAENSEDPDADSKLGVDGSQGDLLLSIFKKKEIVLSKNPVEDTGRKLIHDRLKNRPKGKITFTGKFIQIKHDFDEKAVALYKDKQNKPSKTEYKRKKTKRETNAIKRKDKLGLFKKSISPPSKIWTKEKCGEAFYFDEFKELKKMMGHLAKLNKFFLEAGRIRENTAFGDDRLEYYEDKKNILISKFINELNCSD